MARSQSGHRGWDWASHHEGTGGLVALGAQHPPFEKMPTTTAG